jgi:hypothetical protein
VVLTVLLVGAAQVGVIYYDSLSVATAAREAARVASENPQSSGLFSSPNSPSAPGAHTCAGAGDSNVVCAAAYKSTYQPGALLDPTQLAVRLQGSVFSGSAPASCPAGSSTSDGVVTVTASYNVPIFVPLLNQVLATPNQSYRTVTTTVSVRVEPCDVTVGN